MRLLDIAPVASIDLETTGVDTATARIVQIGVSKLHPSGHVHTWQEYVNPGITIPQGATDVHGITNAMVANAKPWGPELLCQLALMLDGVNALTGYNLRRYDMDVLDAEHKRSCAPLAKPWAGIPVIDALDVWHRIEPRDLSTAVLKWTGTPLAGAHTAGADSEAALRVLSAMLPAWGEQGGAHELSRASLPQGARNWVDQHGKLKRDDRGDVCIAFGRYDGTRITQVDSGFLRWMLDPVRGFSDCVLEYVRAELARRVA